MRGYEIPLILCIILTCHGVEGLRKNIFYGEDIHSESQKFDDETTTYVECVDIHKQPAFEDPILKNHKIQMEPSFNMKRGNALEYDKNKKHGFLEEHYCPNGYVPIQRRKGGMIKPKPLSLDDPGEHHYAVMNDWSKIYRGASSTMTINQPQTEVQPSLKRNQYSASFVWLSSGRDEYTEISGGWMVNPKLYGDNKVRLTAAWSDDLLNGCYNTLCPGFVQINQKLHVGAIFSNVTTKEKIYEFKLSIGQDVISGNWWLVYGVQNIGYWPKESFPKLNNGVNSLSFGGVTYAPEGSISPPMGEGTFPGSSSGSAFFFDVQTIDVNYRVGDIDLAGLEFYRDKLSCYNIADYDYAPRFFFYGGPGGNCSL